MNWKDIFKSNKYTGPKPEAIKKKPKYEKVKLLWKLVEDRRPKRGIVCTDKEKKAARALQVMFKKSNLGKRPHEKDSVKMKRLRRLVRQSLAERQSG